jgi:hypothetical protein
MNILTDLFLLFTIQAHVYCEDLATTGYFQGDVRPIVETCKELLFDCMIDEGIRSYEQGIKSFDYCSKHWSD